MEHVNEWRVLARKTEAEDVVTLVLLPAEGNMPSFLPGQFVNVYLPELSVEGKSYSIVSAPQEPHLSLTIRSRGRFSSALSALKRWERVVLSEPHGFFYPVDKATPRVFLAAGIGIAPFMSILRASRPAPVVQNPGSEQQGPRTALLYSNRDERTAPFLRELDTLSAEEASLTVRHFFTRAKAPPARAAALRHINADDIADAARVARAAHWFLCGGIPFVRDMRLAIRSLGIAEDAIFTESFF